MEEIVADGYKDVKTLNLTLSFIANCARSGTEFVYKVVRETCVLEVTKYISTQKEGFD